MIFFWLAIQTTVALSFAQTGTKTVTQTSTSSSLVTAVSTPLSQGDKKILWAQFQKALDNDERALAHRERAELKQLAFVQNARKKSWREQEKKARAQYFESHSGPERREYVLNYISRKKALDQALQDETNRTKKSWADQAEAMKRNRKDRELRFKAALSQNQRPDDSLWTH